MTMFQKILVANRGEIARRIIRGAKEMGISTVAVYSEADENSPHVKDAGESALIGPASALKSYLNQDKIFEVAREKGCDAVHPGYGFLAENADFARRCGEEGFAFIGPSPSVMEKVGSKLEARQTVAQAGVPILPGSPPLLDVGEAHHAATELGYPVMLKASGGGGGIGMNWLDSPEKLDKGFKMSSNRAKAAFGDSTLYLEKALAGARHIEVQILADHHGNCIHLYERECSIQRRYQKLVEESPAPHLSDEVRKKLCQAAVDVGKAVGYDNAGTVEFLVVGDEFYFLEVNARIQVEHPVTEMVTGIDLIHQQIKMAAGEQLPVTQKAVPFRGAAIECRIYAENPDKKFRPSPGKIERLVLPVGDGIRNECGVVEGYEVSVYYDPLLAKLIVYGEDRPQVLERLKAALGQYVVEGIDTTLPYFAALLERDEFIEGRVTTQFEL